MADENPFKWRQYQPEIILLCVRWYLRYALSYRDLEELMAERGLGVDHTTVFRWVQRYVYDFLTLKLMLFTKVSCLRHAPIPREWAIAWHIG